MSKSAFADQLVLQGIYLNLYVPGEVGNRIFLIIRSTHRHQGIYLANGQGK
jgi:hypothetical protein